MVLYKGKLRLYVCKSPTEVSPLLHKSRHNLGATYPPTGLRYATDRKEKVQRNESISIYKLYVFLSYDAVI